MLRKVRDAADQAVWRERGFELHADEIARIEGFFTPWFEVYRRPDVEAFASQEALFAIHYGLEAVVRGAEPGKKSRWAVSALRAGYCVARVERDMRLRSSPDDALIELLRLRAENERWPSDGMGRAITAGQAVGEIAERMSLEDPEMAAEIPGFDLREAVFADLRGTLFVKLKATSLPHRFESEAAAALMRFGHAVGFVEESLPSLTPRYRR